MFERVLQILEMRVNDHDLLHSERCIAQADINTITAALLIRDKVLGLDKDKNPTQS